MTAATAERLDFDALYREHHGAIERYMRTRAPQHADDLASEVWLRAIKGAATYRPAAGTPEGWLYGIAGNVVADHYRTAARRPATVELPDTDWADPADVATQACDRADATAALAQIPGPAREVVARRYLADETVADTATDLGMAAGTVKSACSRALAALRTALGVVVPATVRTPEPPADAPEPVTAARSATVATPDRHASTDRRRPRGPRRPVPRHRCPVPAAGGGGTADPPRHPAPTAARHGGRRHQGHQPVARCPRPAPHPGQQDLHRTGLAVPRRGTPPGSGLRPLHQRRQGGDPTMTYETATALLPFLIAATVALCASICAQIADNGDRVHRKRYSRDAITALDGRRLAVRYEPGRSAQATPTAFLPRFLPDAPHPSPDSAIGREPEPLPEPKVRAWPAPVLESRPEPTPVEAWLFEATGTYPVLDESTVRSDVTMLFRPLTDEYLAELDASQRKAVAA